MSDRWVSSEWVDAVEKGVKRAARVHHDSNAHLQSAVSLIDMVVLDLEDDLTEARAGARRFDFGDAAPAAPGIPVANVVPKLSKKLDMIRTHLQAVKFDYLPEI